MSSGEDPGRGSCTSPSTRWSSTARIDAMEPADAPQMSRRHAALAARAECLRGRRVGPLRLRWARDDRDSMVVRVVIGPAILLRVVSAPWWLAVVWLAVGLVLVLSLATDWWTIAVTDSAIVVLRNSKLSFRRAPAGVVTGLTYDEWPDNWTPASGLTLREGHRRRPDRPTSAERSGRSDP